MDILAEYLESAKSAALEAGNLVRSHLKDAHKITNKSPCDFVTEVDRLSESYNPRPDSLSVAVTGWGTNPRLLRCDLPFVGFRF